LKNENAKKFYRAGKQAVSVEVGLPDQNAVCRPPSVEFESGRVGLQASRSERW
jgi:hypothetical protein